MLRCHKTELLAVDKKYSIITIEIAQNGGLSII